MKKKRSLRWGRFLLFLLLAAAFGAMGSSYGSWNAELRAESKLTTGKMEFLFSPPEKTFYAAVLTDGGAKGAEVPLEAEFILEDKGKSVRISFGNGLPAAELMKGRLLKVTLPLEPGEESSVTHLRTPVPDLTVPGETVEMKPEKVLIAADGICFPAGKEADAFRVPLKFDAYYGVLSRKTGAEEEDIKSEIYLRLNEESIRALEALPRTIRVAEPVKTCESPAVTAGRISSGSGVMVTYSCELPLFLDQKEATEAAEKQKEGK